MTTEHVHPCPYALHGIIYQSCPRIVHDFEGAPCKGCCVLNRAPKYDGPLTNTVEQEERASWADREERSAEHE